MSSRQRYPATVLAERVALVDRQQVLDTVEGRSAPPPGGARLALVAATPVDEDGFEPFGDDDEKDDDYYDDDED